MPDIDTSRPQSCGCGEASYADCACNPKPLPWGSGQATFPHGAQSPSRAPSPVDTSPAALRALAAKAGLTEPADRMAAPFWAAAARDALRALAAEKEAPSAAIDAVLRDAMASGIGIARIAPEEFFARADEKEAATVKPDLTVGAEVMPVKVVAVMGLRPAPAQESSSIGPALADLRTLAETATPGPWQVMTYRIPFSITRHDGTTCSGEHVGWDIATVRHHPQSHAPEPIVTLGIGVTQEPPVPFVHIRPEDADYLAAVSPEVVLALLDEIAALRTRLAAAEKERDALRLAILGGEDAPGYATTVSIDDAISALEDGRRLYRYCAEKAEAERGKLIMALDHLLYPKPASGTRVYTLPDGQRECLTATQYDEACARHLLQTLATQDLLALSPGVETSPANPEDSAHD